MCFSQCSLGSILRSNLRSSLSKLGGTVSLETYTYDEYIRDFERSYAVGSDEYNRRAQVFQASLKRVMAINAKNAREDRSWWAGVHPFMDWTQAERSALNGYKPSRAKAGSAPGGLAALQTFGNAGVSTRFNASFYGDSASWEGVAMRQQGSCGSCWAISAVEAVEARLPANTKLAAQALVDCVPNPHHCGGKGGCDGATGELAYEFIRDHGIPLESNYAYTAETGSCPMNPATDLFPASQRARVAGWTTLPSNKAQPLMEALYSQGPVVVAVDANDWFDYDNGVFDGCKKDATLGHAVLAKGYGGEGSTKYWRIQNSWGGNWGEKGHIRLKRQDAAAEEQFCGQDRKPQEGLGCDGGPPEVTVCGMCGILFDPIYPTGVTLEGGDSHIATPSPMVMRDVKLPEMPKPSSLDEAPPVMSDDAASDEDRKEESSETSKTNAVAEMKEMFRRGRI